MAAVTEPLTSISPERIVVFLPNWVGDAVMATPALRALRQRFASARITFFGKPASVAVLDGSGLCDATALDRLSGSSTRQGAFAAGRRLRSEKFDLAVLLPNSFRSALIARRARISRRLGYDRDHRGWLLTDRRQPPRGEQVRHVGRGLFNPDARVRQIDAQQAVGPAKHWRKSRERGLDGFHGN